MGVTTWGSPSRAIASKKSLAAVNSLPSVSMVSLMLIASFCLTL